MAERALRIGVLSPHAAPGPEVEFPAILPGRLVTCVARVSTDVVSSGGGGTELTTVGAARAGTAPQLLDEAADLFARGGTDAIGFASTSSAYALGFEEESGLLSRLARRLGTPVVGSCASAVLALRVLEVERIALVEPPWFDERLNESGAAYFRGQGFDVVSSASAGLSQDPGRIESAAVVEWTTRHVGDEAEAVFIGGNGFRAAGAIDALEAALERPVLSSNQVLLWSILGHAGATFEISGYGQLFSHEAPITAAAAPRGRSVL
jgi:maleate isomerase